MSACLCRPDSKFGFPAPLLYNQYYLPRSPVDRSLCYIIITKDLFIVCLLKAICLSTIKNLILLGTKCHCSTRYPKPRELNCTIKFGILKKVVPPIHRKTINLSTCTHRCLYFKHTKKFKVQKKSNLNLFLSYLVMLILFSTLEFSMLFSMVQVITCFHDIISKESRRMFID